jgi:Methylated DNA-protein cysteine methyltransferase
MSADADAGLYSRELAALGRHVQIGLAQGRVLAVEFPQTPAAEAESGHELLDRIAAYLGGTRDAFDDVSVALTMRTDHREVLETVRDVPYGETTTVDRLTAMTPGLDADADAAEQTVRAALGANPAPIFVPTHRVRDGPGGAPAAVTQTLRSVEGISS